MRRGEHRYRSHVFVRSSECSAGARYDSTAGRHELAELDLSAAAETLLPGTVFHLQGKSKPVQPGVHGLVEDRRGYFRVGKVRIDAECELDQTRVLLMKVRTAAGESLDDDVGKVALEMPEVVRDVSLD